jgi:hypothetical protein
MKKYLLALLLTTACIYVASAQLRYGVKGGLNLSDIVITNYINPDAESDFDLKIGPQAGLFTCFDVNEQFSFDVELVYSNRGVVAASRINLHYITLPLMTQYHINDKFLLEIGPDIGYLFSAKSGNGNVSNIYNNKLDIGLDGGAQLKVTEKLSVGLRYYAGFSSVVGGIDSRDTNNFPTNETIKYQNRALQLFVSYHVGEKL